MNKLTIIGNLVRDPEMRTTNNGHNVCQFTVAVNRRRKEDGADFFRVSAWDKLAEICANALKKGSKVAVVGSVSVSTYKKDGENRFTLEVKADDVEFLTPKSEAVTEAPKASNGYTEITDEDLPF